MAIKRISPGPRLSQAVTYGDTVYVAGQVAGDTNADASGQTRQILAQIDSLLAAANTDKSKLLWANVWLADIADFGAMNAVWETWVAPGQTPARATVEARLAGPQYKVEIACIAGRPAEAAPHATAKRSAKGTAKRAKPAAKRKRR